MKRRIFGREFKIEAVKLIRERGVSVVQAIDLSADGRLAVTFLRHEGDTTAGHTAECPRSSQPVHRVRDDQWPRYPCAPMMARKLPRIRDDPGPRRAL